METDQITQLTVHQLLDKYPSVIKVFISFAPVCIGCSVERFCTLEDVTQHYDIPLQEWTHAIEEAISSVEKRRGT